MEKLGDILRQIFTPEELIARADEDAQHVLARRHWSKPRLDIPDEEQGIIDITPKGDAWRELLRRHEEGAELNSMEKKQLEVISRLRVAAGIARSRTIRNVMGLIFYVRELRRLDPESRPAKTFHAFLRREYGVDFEPGEEPGPLGAQLIAEDAGRRLERDLCVPEWSGNWNWRLPRRHDDGTEGAIPL